MTTLIIISFDNKGVLDLSDHISVGVDNKEKGVHCVIKHFLGLEKVLPYPPFNIIFWF